MTESAVSDQQSVISAKPELHHADMWDHALWFARGRWTVEQMQAALAEWNRDNEMWYGAVPQITSVYPSRMRRYPDLSGEYAFTIQTDVPAGRGAFIATCFTDKQLGEDP